MSYEMMSTSDEKGVLPTFVPGLDELLGGGLPPRQTVLITGNPGTGKTVLCSQILFNHARRGTPVVLATVTSEPHDKLLHALSGFAFFDRERVGREIFLVSAYTQLKSGSKEARDLLLQTVREHKAKVLFVDGLRAVRDLWQDEARLREFLYMLITGLAASDCVGLIATEYSLPRLLEYPEATTVDGVVALSTLSRGSRRLRRVEVVKLRGRPHLLGEHVMRVRSDGVSALPRLESTPVPPVAVRDEPRAQFGHPELDTLLRGGLPRPSATILAGSMGIGKTLLALHFAAAGCVQGEPCYVLSFHEPAEVLISRALRVGLDLRPHVAAGRLEVAFAPPDEADADEVVAAMLARVARLGARRLVIDGLTLLEHAVAEPERAERFFGALLLRLRAAGVAVLFTKEVSKTTGPELDFNDTPLALLSENLVLLRYRELQGRVHRMLSVLKMRDSGYDPYPRELEIVEEGLRVLPAPDGGRASDPAAKPLEAP